MPILAIETSTSWCSVAILFPNGQSFYKQGELGALTSQNLLLWVSKLLEEAQINLSELSSFAVSIGPGAFTGIRLGVSVSQGLAFALKKPLISVVSLDGFAKYAYKNNLIEIKDDEKLLVLMDARMNQVYYSSYQYNKKLDQLIPIGSPQLADIKTLSQLAITKILGYHIDEYAIDLKTSGIDTWYSLEPHALGVALLAKESKVCIEKLDPKLCMPIYIRDKVAETTKERLASKLAKI